MKLSFSPQSIAAVFKRNISISLWLFLIVVLGLEALVIKRSADILLSSRATPPLLQTQVVRVNLKQYTAIEERFGSNASFQPTAVDYANPFGINERVTTTP